MNDNFESVNFARKHLKQTAKKVESKLESYFDIQIKNAFGVSAAQKQISKDALERIKDHCLRPAKRLRASLMITGYELLGGANFNNILDASLSIELVHTALLIHDDIMDQDEIRRGSLTTHKQYERQHSKNLNHGDAEHYGISQALNTGDIALLLGHQILSQSNFEPEIRLKAVSRLLSGAIRTGYGQGFDMYLEAKGKATETDIIDLHTAKTAIYTYENPLHVGAILANADKKELNILSRFALPAGIGFQLQDDILGLFGDPQKTGKAADSDLKQGKMTLLIRKAFQYANASQAKTLNKIWGNRKLSKANAQLAREIIIETGSLEYSKELSRKYAKKAQESLQTMRNQGWKKERVDYLEGIAQYMIERKL